MEIFPVYGNFELNSNSTIFITFLDISQLHESTLKISFKTQQHLSKKWFTGKTGLNIYTIHVIPEENNQQLIIKNIKK